ncbi:MAG TPA: NAD(P)/FAD-dependent oxidoreductase, partial [Thermoprotei archaeon]|nr:NAD(P)/FAD-dependent oxidoreductase [Thermoprotei archaeon]
GGGPVGIEVATLYNALGCRVSIFEMMNTLLPGLDRDISKRLEYNLRRMGIKVYTSKKILKVKTGDKVYVYLEDGSRYSFDNIVLAIGRTPNTDNDLIRGIDLKLDEKGFIVVDGMQATNIKGIYAAGDVTGPPMLAHKAYFEGLNAAESIVNKRALRKPDYIPLTVYSYPEVFTIGLSEYGHDYLESVKIPLTVSGKAFSEDVKGLIKIVYSRRDRRVYGIHIIGDIASSLSELSTVIVENSLKYDLIIDTLFPHPSYGEAIWEALAYLEGMSIHLD